jgi:hypothetical protein
MASLLENLRKNSSIVDKVRQQMQEFVDEINEDFDDLNLRIPIYKKSNFIERCFLWKSSEYFVEVKPKVELDCSGLYMKLTSDEEKLTYDLRQALAVSYMNPYENENSFLAWQTDAIKTFQKIKHDLATRLINHFASANLKKRGMKNG